MACSRGRSCLCDSAEESYSTLCTHDKLAHKAKCGHKAKGGFVVFVERKKNRWHTCATMETHLVTAPALPTKAGPAFTRSIPWSVRLDDDEGRRKHERDYGRWDEAPVTVSWTDWGTELKRGRGVGGRALGRLAEIKSHVWWWWWEEGGGSSGTESFHCGLSAGGTAV